MKMDFQLIPGTTPERQFKDHESVVTSVAIFPDRRRMVTGSLDNTLRVWDLKTGVVLNKMVGHRGGVWGLAVSRDGKLIASGDNNGDLIAWHGATGEYLTQVMEAHSTWIEALDFSPGGTTLATSGSQDRTTRLWSTESWQEQGNPIKCSDWVRCIRYSPSGELLAIATDSNIEIYNPSTRECIVKFKGHTVINVSLAWTPDSTRLLSGGNYQDPSIREWNTSTWQQVGDAWTGHINAINAITVHPTGRLVASASTDSHIRLWRLSDRRTIAIFQRSSLTQCITFSVDGRHILSGGDDNVISEWAVPRDALSEEFIKKPASKVQVSDLKILTINTTVRNACIAGDLSAAEELFTQEIDTATNNYTSYANRSFVMARKYHWDCALQDAIKSVSIEPSLAGYISKGIALCGKELIWDAMRAFDLAFMFANENSNIVHFLLLIKAIAIFNAGQHEEAIIRVQELAAACPNNDTVACRIVESYLCFQLGINAMDDAHHNEAADHFTAAVNSDAFSSTSAIHSIYEDLVVLFGWDLKSLWKNAHQKRCDALRQAGRLEEAMDSYRDMMDRSDENTQASCLDWSNAFKQECSMFYLANADAALAANDHDRAINLYSEAIVLMSSSDTICVWDTTITSRSMAKSAIGPNSSSDTIFASRSKRKSTISPDFPSGTIFANRNKVKSENVLWEDVLLDAEKFIELNPSSHVGYQVKRAALHGAQRYDEAMEAFRIMLSKLDKAPDIQIRRLREQFINPSEAEGIIRRVIDIQLDTTPLRLINTATGFLCDREAQINAFKKSSEYKELLSSSIKHPLRIERITEAVATYFRCVMLSHRWEGKEPLLQDIQDKIVYKLNSLGGIVKLRTFCEIVRDAGYRWAWSDTCCIDKSNNVELQESLNSMFVWYRHSALTIVYLSDVLPSSQPGALAKSEWNRRGWTFQEFLASKFILFYQKNWTLYLDDHSSNHKDSTVIMEELHDATGIDRQALAVFRPGMSNARERLQWASSRVTTLQEDIAYSLFGIFGVHLPVIYGEKKQNALGRLLQEIVARSGDITALDWVGQSSDFNSCLPADITSYAAPPFTAPSLSEDEIRTIVSSLRNIVDAELASKLYTLLDNMRAPRFAHCRLYLPCMVFRVTEVRRRRDLTIGHASNVTYGVKADGLQDLLITTEGRLIQFTPARPIRQTILLVRPWNRYLLEPAEFTEPPEFGDDTVSEDEYWSAPGSLLDDSPGSSDGGYESVDSESISRAFRLIVRLGQPFSALLLAQQFGGEYKRIASDHNIIAEVKDIASVDDMMDIRSLEIL